jgi:hypothetical protein
MFISRYIILTKLKIIYLEHVFERCLFCINIKCIEHQNSWYPHLFGISHFSYHLEMDVDSDNKIYYILVLLYFSNNSPTNNFSTHSMSAMATTHLIPGSQSSCPQQKHLVSYHFMSFFFSFVIFTFVIRNSTTICIVLCRCCFLKNILPFWAYKMRCE